MAVFLFSTSTLKDPCNYFGPTRTIFLFYVQLLCKLNSHFHNNPVYIHVPGNKMQTYSCNEGHLGLIPGLGRSSGEGKDYLPQYSGLESSMDCIVHGVTKSWTWLKLLSTSHFFLSDSCNHPDTILFHSFDVFVLIDPWQLRNAIVIFYYTFLSISVYKSSNGKNPTEYFLSPFYQRWRISLRSTDFILRGLLSPLTRFLARDTIDILIS